MNAAHLEHPALLYASTEDVLEYMVPYVTAGLDDDESCSWRPGETIWPPFAPRSDREGAPPVGRTLRNGTRTRGPGSAPSMSWSRISWPQEPRASGWPVGRPRDRRSPGRLSPALRGVRLGTRLWLARQLVDLLQVVPGRAGTTVRLHVRLA